MTRLTAVALSVLLASAGAYAQGGDAAAPAKTIAPYLEAETLAVIHIDLAKLNLPGVWEKIEKLAGEDAKSLAEPKAESLKWLAAFTKAGGKEVFVVITTTDLPLPPVYAVVPVGETADVKALINLLTTGQAEAAPATTAPRRSPQALFAAGEKIGGAVVVGGPRTLKRLKENQPVARPELAEALAAVKDCAIQAVLIPSDNHRKIVEQLLPTLPPELGGGETTPLTKGAKWLALGETDFPKMHIKLVIQSPDEAGAKGVNEFIAGVFKAAGELKELKETFGGLFAQVAALLTPKQEKDRNVIELGEEQINKLVGEILMPAMRRARELAKRAMSQGNVRTIGMSLMMYCADHDGQFPPDFQALVKAGLFNEKMLVNPRNPERKPGYIYVRPAVSLEKIKEPDKCVVVYEAYDKWVDGIAVGFADGHVVFVKDEAEFKKLLEASQKPAER